MTYGYVMTGDATRYSKNANAYQKLRLTVETLGGCIFVPRGQAAWCPEDFHRAVVELPVSATGGKLGLLQFRMMRAAKGRVDRLICAPSNEPNFLACAFGAMILRCRYIFCCWDPPGITLHNRTDCLGKLRAWLMKRLFVIAVRHADCVVQNLHSGFLDGWLPQRLRAKVHVFPNGTRCADNHRAAEGVERIRGRVGVNGAFVASKGCWTIARIFYRLWLADHTRSLVWIGAGTDHEAVLRWFAEQGIPQSAVIAPGMVSNEEVMRLLATCELALNAYDNLPSWRWNYVLKIPEFLSLGLPVVTSATLGAASYITESAAGATFPPGDEKAAAEELEALLSSEQLLQWQTRCRELAQTYDWGAINQRIADTLSRSGMPQVVVALTSYGIRVQTVHQVIETLLRQTRRPDRIVLYLAKTEFADNEALPASLRALLSSTFEVRFVDDLRSHKKYFYAFREFPDAIVITTDDDILYPPHLIKGLLASWQRHPHAVSAARAHTIVMREDGTFAPYAEWMEAPRVINRPSFLVMPTGAGGILYPPRCFSEALFDWETIQKTCLKADDLWLKWHELERDVPCVYIPRLWSGRTTEGSQVCALWNHNGSHEEAQTETPNERAWRLIMEARRPQSEEIRLRLLQCWQEEVKRGGLHAWLVRQRKCGHQPLRLIARLSLSLYEQGFRYTLYHALHKRG